MAEEWFWHFAFLFACTSLLQFGQKGGKDRTVKKKTLKPIKHVTLKSIKLRRRNLSCSTWAHDVASSVVLFGHQCAIFQVVTGSLRLQLLLKEASKSFWCFNHDNLVSVAVSVSGSQGRMMCVRCGCEGRANQNAYHGQSPTTCSRAEECANSGGFKVFGAVMLLCIEELRLITANDI